MNQKEYEEQISALEEQVRMLQEAGLELLNRNMQLSQQLDIYYDVRRRIEMLKELVIRHQELMSNADMRNDDELMALIETRLEQEHPYEDPNFGLAELADFIGTSKSRLIKLFRNLNFYRSADDYLDYMRLAALPRDCQTTREHDRVKNVSRLFPQKKVVPQRPLSGDQLGSQTIRT